MRFTLIAAVTYVAVAQAFNNTSPFLMFSTKQFPDSVEHASRLQIQSSSDVLGAAKQVIAGCGTEIYYIITQPELNALALSRSLNHLRPAMNHRTTKSILGIAEVVGFESTDRDDLVKFVQEKCGAKVSNAFVDRARYGARKVAITEQEPLVGGWTESEEKLGRSDPGLQANVLNDLAAHHSYTFILLSTPISKLVDAVEDPIYEAEFSDAVHMDLKRSLYARKGNSTTETDQRPLFEKYQFLSPGLFMGLLVGFILLSILGVGLSAIAGLKVSYGAFDKEMGPGAQKKSQ